MRYEIKNIESILGSMNRSQLVIRLKAIDLQRDVFFYLCYAFILLIRHFSCI